MTKDNFINVDYTKNKKINDSDDRKIFDKNNPDKLLWTPEIENLVKSKYLFSDIDKFSLNRKAIKINMLKIMNSKKAWGKFLKGHDIYLNEYYTDRFLEIISEKATIEEMPSYDYLNSVFTYTNIRTFFDRQKYKLKKWVYGIKSIAKMAFKDNNSFVLSSVNVIIIAKLLERFNKSYEKCVYDKTNTKNHRTKLNVCGYVVHDIKFNDFITNAVNDISNRLNDGITQLLVKNDQVNIYYGIELNYHPHFVDEVRDRFTLKDKYDSGKLPLSYFEENDIDMCMPETCDNVKIIFYINFSRSENE